MSSKKWQNAKKDVWEVINEYVKFGDTSKVEDLISELQLHRASHQSVKDISFQDTGELISAYKRLVNNGV